MDGPQEYEVESITRARVHDKKGKKITWKYYVKWKGYDWNESTWEPTDSFQGGSEHILESFWERIDTSGRDISDAAAFKKGEELFISGPPGRKVPKRKVNATKSQVSLPPKDVPSSDDAALSAPPLVPRKRQRMQITADEHAKQKRRASTRVPKNEGMSAKSPKRRRASSPGLRKSAHKRLPSPGDSQLDADGETDPDVVEVEDELMQASAEDVEESATEARYPVTAGSSTNESKDIKFDDLVHFYSGFPIDIDQNTDEQVAAPKPEVRPQLQSSPSTADNAAPDSQVHVSPTLSSPDPLFDSPSRFPSKAPEGQSDLTVPHHRARSANPLVKLIDTTTPEIAGKQSGINIKARLTSLHSVEVHSTAGPSRNTTKRGGKPGPGRSSSGLKTKNRSSLLTAANGALKSVKGKFTGTTTGRDQTSESEEALVTYGTTEGGKFLVISRNDEDAIAEQDHQTMSNSQPGPPPSGDELLRLAGLQADPEILPDYEEVSAAQPQDVKNIQGPKVMPPSVEGELPNPTSVEVLEECRASSHVTDVLPSGSELKWQTPTPVIDDPFVSSVVTPPTGDEAVKKNIELAKEHLFPSAQTSFDVFTATSSSFRSTIFGPLYQGSTADPMPVPKNEFSTTFKVILSDNVELPLVLKDRDEIKAQISDILIGNSSGGKVALFYSAEDALAMVSTFKSDGTARVVLDPSAKPIQQEKFSTFLQRFESSQTLVAPVGKEVCVLYASDNADVAEKLGTPSHLRGLESTLLISHACIENQLAYVAVIMKAAAL